MDRRTCRTWPIRDRGCIGPDCDAPVSRTQAHHVVHWADGGPTDLSNLALVCGHDHRRVHTGALVAHVLDGRPVITRAGEPPPASAPPPWRARLEDLAHELHHPDDPSRSDGADALDGADAPDRLDAPGCAVGKEGSSPGGAADDRSDGPPPDPVGGGDP
ncbi:HNH endonuclease signature motif containing protein [Pseudokineococcus sp. 5B2Z-1]|uniref:HNH endonuclease signature motif containing protein n=1 Tax=Pseudokineococcus sp. 5B2Z-1 TaxID=3132744 RepID=UPI00309EFB8B